MAGEPRFAVLAKVEHNLHVLKECDEEFRADKEIVLIAVEKSVYAFQIAADELKRDRDTVLEAVQINWSCLQVGLSWFSLRCEPSAPWECPCECDPRHPHLHPSQAMWQSHKECHRPSSQF
eukprot:4872142-Amphidinium_carterae.2